ncbi:MAG: hypothetical protein ACE5GA_10900, partial [Candidatus Zixiibacteriota bacterium]
MQSGLLSTYQNKVSNRSYVAWIISAALLAFYVLMYFTTVFDPLAAMLGLSSRWWLYGALYTSAI